MKEKQKENKIYELAVNDYLLKKVNGDYLKWSNGNFIIYASESREEEIVYKGEKWIKATDLPKDIKEQLIQQIKRNNLLTNEYK